ncbi:hypothetical protein PINS_up011388 [Pythium insidiosum]|nr:hypothetical protein PINS_up011388 [Pythium insidiosum]
MLQLRSSGGGASVSSGSASVAAPVVRLVLLFTGEMDLYEVMQSLKLPSSMQFDHLLQRFTMRWLFSHSLEELLTNKRLVLGSQWSCRGQLDVRFNRQAVGQILRQCARKMTDDIAMERDERSYVAEEREHRRQSEQSRATQGRDPTVPVNASSPRRKPESALPQQQYQHRAARDPVVEEEEQQDPRYMRKWLGRLGLFIDAAKELSATWSFPGLTQLLTRHRWIHDAVLSRARFEYLQNLLTTAGGLALEWKQMTDSFRAEFANSSFVISALAASTAPSTTAPGTLSRMYSRATSRSGLQVPEELLRLNTGGLSSSFPFASPLPTAGHMGTSRESARIPSSVFPSSRVTMRDEDAVGDEQEEPSSRMENELLEFYEMCVKTLASVHTIRAEAGTSGVTCVTEGLNVFSVLPRVVPLTTVKRASLVRTRSTASSTSNSGLSAATTPSYSTSTPQSMKRNSLHVD